MHANIPNDRRMSSRSPTFFHPSPRNGWLVASVCLLACSTTGAGCSPLGQVYAKAGYNAQGSDAIKRIVVAAWAPTQPSKLDALMARLAVDMVKLRKNYLVHDGVTAQRGFGPYCNEPIEGVLLMRALDVKEQPSSIRLKISAELFRCSDGALLWRADADEDTRSDDEDLQQLTAAYRADFGAVAERFAAPTFAVLQDLVGALPDVTLNDEEVLEKIELGSLPMTPIAQLHRPAGSFGRVDAP